MMTRRALLTTAVPTTAAALLSGHPLNACAQGGTDAAKDTLQHALGEAAPPAIVTISIGPQWEKLPKDAKPPKNGASVAQVAAVFRKARRAFGSVVAVSFPTMTVLNTAPGTPDPFDAMPFSDLMPLFAASLSEAQYNALSSAQGLTIGGLDERQKNMAMQLFENGKFLVGPWVPQMYGSAPANPLDFTDQIGATRLRLKQTMDVGMPSESGGTYESVKMPPADSSKTLKLVPRQDYGGSRDKVYGQVVRATLPNGPKRGQLNLKQERLRRAVSLNGVTTVREAIARIAKATGLELYADARWNHKTVQVLLPESGAANVVAADLLQAIAFCLSATFRQVGPAFVMTDDIVGYGTRRLLWHEFERFGNAMRQQPVENARNTMWARYKDRPLPTHDDPAALTEEQTKIEWNQVGKNYSGRPLADFTDEQQTRIRSMIKIHNEMYTSQPVKEGGNYRISESVSLQLIVPSSPLPVETGIQLGKSALLQMSEAERKAQNEAAQEAIYDKGLSKNPKEFLENLRKSRMWQYIQREFPAMSARLLLKYPVLASLPQASAPSLVGAAEIARAWAVLPKRAVRIYPKTVSDVSDEFAAAKRIGANEVWLVANTDGGGAYDNEMVDAAREAAKRDNYGLVLLVNVLNSGKMDKPIPAAADRTLLGEMSSVALARSAKRIALQGKYWHDEERFSALPVGNVLSPKFDAVRAAALAAVKAVAALPEVDRVVLCDWEFDGYRESDNPEYNYREASSLSLGYNEAMRLAFLRSHGCDPIDLYNPVGYGGKANTDIVNYQYDTGVTNDLYQKWKAFRRETVMTLMRDLHRAAQPKPVLVQATMQFTQSYSDTVPYPKPEFRPWPDTRKTPPQYSGDGGDMATLDYDFLRSILTNATEFWAQAKLQRLLIDTGGVSLAKRVLAPVPPTS